jgi:hypothetical protein
MEFRSVLLGNLECNFANCKTETGGGPEEDTRKKAFAGAKRGAGRPEANSDLHKWTANGLRSTARPATISNAGSNLRGSQQARLLAGQLRIVLSRRTTQGEAYHGAF